MAGVIVMAMHEGAAVGGPQVIIRDVITDQAARGDGGNAWGPHKCRIVRTADGVFTVYTAPGSGHLKREWRLMWHDDAAGKWAQLAAGDAGREPPNLLATPDGTLHLFGWPGGRARHWWGTPRADGLELQSEAVPGLDGGDWPYSAAGADRHGNLCVLSVSAGEKPGGMRWVSRDAAGAWSPVRSAAVDYRCCYAFLFPEAGGGLTLAATRDVKWDVLGYSLPAGVFGYAFDEVRSWRAAPDGTLTAGVSILEKPTDAFPNVMRMVQDAYLDTAGRLHLVYAARGAATLGEPRLRQAVAGADGQLLGDAPLPETVGEQARLFQDDRGGFWLLGSAGVIYRGEADDKGALRWGDPVKLDLGGRQVQREGFFVAVPRTGTPRGSVIDAVFPAGEVKREPWQNAEAINAGHPGWHDWNLYAPQWVYVRIALAAQEGMAADSTSPPVNPNNRLGPYGQWAADLLDEGPERLSWRNPKFKKLEAWRAEAVAKTRELLLIPEMPWKPEARVERAFAYDGLAMEELSWQLPYGPRTRALFMKPVGAKGRLPAVLALHDHGGRFEWGVEKITRTSADQSAALRDHQSYYGGRAWANELAKRGYAVLVHDVVGFASRRPAQDEEIFQKSLLCAGTLWAGLIVYDDQRALDYLASRPDVDASRLACGGLSGGAVRTVFLGGLDPRLKAAFPVGWLTTWRDLMLDAPHNHSWMPYVPGLARELDYPEILGLRVPLHTFVLNDADDQLFTLKGMQAADAVLREVYAKAGAPDNYRCKFYSGQHKFDAAMQQDAFTWLDGLLQPMKEMQ